MKFNLIIIFFLVASCVETYNATNVKIPYTSKGLAYIYNDEDFAKKNIKKKLDNNLFQIAHNKLRPGTLIRIINPKNNKSIVLKNSKRFEYPEFFKILITKPVAEKLNLRPNLPFIELIEIKRNKSFVAKKTKIYKEEEKIHSNAPVEIVKIDNISKNKKKKQKSIKKKFYIVIGDFYSKKSISLLKDRIKNELTGYDSKKLSTNLIKSNKIRLLSGPYNSINLMKNDYIQLKKFGFEELDIALYE